MNRNNVIRSTGLALVLTLWSGMSLAGPYGDSLAKCLVSATTEADRTALVKWMFTASAAHPAIEPIVSVSPEQATESNKVMGEMVTKLLVDLCRTETEEALQFEGEMTLQTAFSVLGQVAGRELFSSPEVADAMAGFEAYLDTDALVQVVGQLN